METKYFGVKEEDLNLKAFHDIETVCAAVKTHVRSIETDASMFSGLHYPKGSAVAFMVPVRVVF